MNRLEIIVCIIIFLVIASLFLPATRDARETARRTQCLNNMRNIGVAVQTYATDHRGDMPATQAGQPPRSWRLQLVPYLVCSCMHDEYCFDLRWNEGANLETAKNGLEILGCPDDPSTESLIGLAVSSYAAITGTNTIWGKERSQTLDEITKADGLANTILISEAEADEIVWTEPRDVDLDRKKIGIETGNRGSFNSEYLMTSMHNGVVNVIFADGSGRHLSENIEPEILKALCTATGGEKLTSEDY